MKFDKFIHERILESKDVIKDTAYGMAGMSIKILERSAKFGVPISKQVIAETAKEFGLDWQRNEGHDAVLSYLVKDLSTNDLMTMAMQITRLCSFPEPAPAYVMSKDFFDDLSEVDISRVNFAFLPEKVRGLIKFPMKLKDDDGCEFDEVFFAIDELKNVFTVVPEKLRYGNQEVKISDKFLGFAWHTPNKGHKGLDPAHLLIPIPEDKSVKIRDAFTSMKIRNHVVSPETLASKSFSRMGDHYHDHNRLMLTALVYILSGQPDLRDFQNPIRYQSPTSQTPVKSDKGLSRVKINLVGYNWKKLPRYNQAVWNVRPYPRMQPYGPGRSQLKLILVREHQRKRRHLNSEDEGAEA